MVPPLPLALGPDREFLLMNFHCWDCLMRQSLNIAGKWKQVAFCPYCRVLNENADTGLSHMQKHLDLMFMCEATTPRVFCMGSLSIDT